MFLQPKKCLLVGKYCDKSERERKKCILSRYKQYIGQERKNEIVIPINDTVSFRRDKETTRLTK